MNVQMSPQYRYHVYSLTNGDWYWMDWDTLTPHGPYTSTEEALFACKQDSDDFDTSRILLSLPPPN
jgi:hypothetical protein